MIKFLSGMFTFVPIAIVSIVLTGTWPVQADTTGVRPNYEDNITTEMYIMDTIISESLGTDSLECMIENLYHEARGEGYAGMYAVAMVVMNRVQDYRYPDTICGVVQQGPVKESWKTRQNPDLKDSERVYWPVRNRCQFSWYCDGKDDSMKDPDAFYMAQEISLLVIDTAVSAYYTESTGIIDITEGATHYHADYVSPAWRNDRGMAKIVKIGKHIFYRWD